MCIPHSLSLAWRLGRGIVAARRDKHDAAGAVAAAGGGCVVFRGEVLDVRRETAEGFARGHVDIFGAEETWMHILQDQPGLALAAVVSQQAANQGQEQRASQGPAARDADNRKRLMRIRIRTKPHCTRAASGHRIPVAGSPRCKFRRG